MLFRKCVSIRTIIATVCATAIGFSCSPCLASAPAHDLCASATVITGTSFSDSLIDLAQATTSACEAQPTCAPNAHHSVWYRFSAPGDGEIHLRASNSGVGPFAFPTVLAVFDACSLPIFGDCAQPAALGCTIGVSETIDPPGPLTMLTTNTANLVVTVSASETYVLELASNQADTLGMLARFDFEFHPAVPNDSCALATPIVGGTFIDVLDTEAAEAACDAANPSCYSGPPSFDTDDAVWYRLDAAFDGVLTLRTEATTYPHIMSVHSGCPTVVPPFGCVSPPELACIEGVPDSGATLAVPVLVNSSYLIRVAATSSSLQQMLRFQADFDPANDVCSQAAVIPASSYHPPLLGIEHTSQTVNEPQENCDTSVFGVSNTVFFQFTPAVNGSATIDTVGSTYDTVLSIFDGCGQFIPPSIYLEPNLLACHNDLGGLLGTVSRIGDFPMLAGQTYVIKVANNLTTGSAGNLDFNFLFAPAPQCPADISPAPSGNGMVNIDDLLMVINNWGATGNNPADVNNDNVVNIDDLLAIINAWGACP